MEQMTLAEYKELGYTERKERIKRNNERMVESIIENGFLLKQIEEDRTYLQDGYKDLNEFAKGEFGYSTSTTSRFKDMNTKFSEGGNSPFIKEEFKGYGRSKLQEMLYIREEDFELLTEEMTVEQMRELKNLEKKEEELRKQEAENDLPLLQMAVVEDAEQKEEIAISQKDPFVDVITAFWSARVELLKLVHNHMISAEDLADELSPSGTRTFNHGIYMIFLYDYYAGVKVRYYKDGKSNTDTYDYESWMEKTNEIITDEIYSGIVSPAKEEEPDLEAEDEVNIEAGKQDMEIVEEPKKEKVPVPEIIERRAENLDNKPLPGQITVSDLPEVTPDDYKEQDTEEHFADVNKMVSEDTQEPPEEEKNQKDRYKREYFLCIAEANNALQKADYDITIKHLQEAIEMVHNMQEC